MTNEGNPFAEIKKIEPSQKLIDIAFSKSIQIRPPSGRMNSFNRSQTHEMNRINTAANVLISRFELIIKSFPSLNKIHPFYLELVSVLVDLDQLKISLGRIQGVIENIHNIEIELIEKLQSSDNKPQNKKIRKMAYARFASLASRINQNLLYLEDARIKLKDIPSFDTTLPCIVLCGFPNTGKSSFIKTTTTGKPEVASYPFTTKKLIFGHKKFDFIQVQFVDTPGILDRPIKDRNQIELQSITAFKYLADVLIFLIDISPNSQYPLSDQINLLLEISNFYHGTRLIPVFSKSDIVNNKDLEKAQSKLREEMIEINQPIFAIQTNDPKGVEDLVRYIETILKSEVMREEKFVRIREFQIADDQELLSEDDEEIIFDLD